MSEGWFGTFLQKFWLSQFPRDELAMAICRVLDSEKPGDEIAGDLLDLAGDSAFETVQDLITHRKELVGVVHHGMLVLKSDLKATSSQPRMPSYGSQVTVQTESERQIDKLRCKEEKKHKRGTDHGNDNDLSAMSFYSLLQASEKKSPFDDLIGTGGGLNTLAATALPQGTVKKHHKGYEEVSANETWGRTVGYCSYYGKKFDPEPGRCRRTDGKKWRCSKDASCSCLFIDHRC